MRIYYQSFLDPDQHGPYFERLSSYLAEVADPGTEFEIGGLTPPDVALSRLTEFRGSVRVVENAIAAAERGIDAIVIGHFQDSGLYPARSAVDVPVLGLGEAAMLHAGQLGRGFGLVTIDEVFSSWHREQVDQYGLRDRFVGVVTTSTRVADLVAAFDDELTYERVIATFEESAQPLVAAGAEVVIPAGGLFALLTARHRRLTVGNALVLNPVSLVAKLAEVAVKLDLRPSRAGTFALAPQQALDEFRRRFS